MGGRSLNPALRTIDVAGRIGYSVQQVRNLERDGALPPVRRTPTGYRLYDEGHVRAGLAYRELAVGVGPVRAKELLRVTHRSPPGVLAGLLDAAHAELDAERRHLALARRAVLSIAEEPIEDPRPSDVMTASELAGALGIPASTLRHWDAEGLVVPGRSGAARARSYDSSAVRDARLVHQLRRAGYRIASMRALLPELRSARRLEEVAAALAARQQDIASRSLALLRAAGHLAALLDAGSNGSAQV